MLWANNTDVEQFEAFLEWLEGKGNLIFKSEDERKRFQPFKLPKGIG